MAEVNSLFAKSGIQIGSTPLNIKAIQPVQLAQMSEFDITPIIQAQSEYRQALLLEEQIREAERQREFDYYKANMDLMSDMYNATSKAFAGTASANKTSTAQGAATNDAGLDNKHLINQQFIDQMGQQGQELMTMFQQKFMQAAMNQNPAEMAQAQNDYNNAINKFQTNWQRNPGYISVKHLQAGDISLKAGISDLQDQRKQAGLPPVYVDQEALDAYEAKVAGIRNSQWSHEVGSDINALNFDPNYYVFEDPQTIVDELVTNQRTANPTLTGEDIFNEYGEVLLRDPSISAGLRNYKYLIEKENQRLRAEGGEDAPQITLDKDFGPEEYIKQLIANKAPDVIKKTTESQFKKGWETMGFFTELGYNAATTTDGQSITPTDWQGISERLIKGDLIKREYVDEDGIQKISFGGRPPQDLENAYIDEQEDNYWGLSKEKYEALSDEEKGRLKKSKLESWRERNMQEEYTIQKIGQKPIQRTTPEQKTKEEAEMGDLTAEQKAERLKEIQKERERLETSYDHARNKMNAFAELEPDQDGNISEEAIKSRNQSFVEFVTNPGEYTGDDEILKGISEFDNEFAEYVRNLRLTESELMDNAPDLIQSYKDNVKRRAMNEVYENWTIKRYIEDDYTSGSKTLNIDIDGPGQGKKEIPLLVDRILTDKGYEYTVTFKGDKKDLPHLSFMAKWFYTPDIGTYSEMSEKQFKRFLENRRWSDGQSWDKGKTTHGDPEEEVKWNRTIQEFYPGGSHEDISNGKLEIWNDSEAGYLEGLNNQLNPISNDFQNPDYIWDETYDLQGYANLVANVEKGTKTSIGGAMGKYQMLGSTAEALNKKYNKNLDPDVPADNRKLFLLLTKENAELLMGEGIEVNDTSLYMAHNIGPRAAADVIKYAEKVPGSPLSFHQIQDPKADPNDANARFVFTNERVTWQTNPAFFFHKASRADLSLDSKDIDKIKEVIERYATRNSEGNIDQNSFKDPGTGEVKDIREMIDELYDIGYIPNNVRQIIAKYESILSQNMPTQGGTLDSKYEFVK